jgi:hypothetical protein
MHQYPVATIREKTHADVQLCLMLDYPAFDRRSARVWTCEDRDLHAVAIKGRPYAQTNAV